MRMYTDTVTAACTILASGQRWCTTLLHVIGCVATALLYYAEAVQHVAADAHSECSTYTLKTAQTTWCQKLITTATGLRATTAAINDWFSAQD
jgi:hypothetical protein